MTSVSDETLEKAVSWLGMPDLSREEIEAQLGAVGVDGITATRLSLFIPEAFGFVLAAHMKDKIAPVKTFSVQDSRKKWVSIPYSSEPIFVLAMERAQAMFHSGPREAYVAIATRSSVMSTIDNALKQGASIEGASMAIAFNGIPAEIYPAVKKTRWERFLAWYFSK